MPVRAPSVKRFHSPPGATEQSKEVTRVKMTWHRRSTGRGQGSSCHRYAAGCARSKGVTFSFTIEGRIDPGNQRKGPEHTIRALSFLSLNLDRSCFTLICGCNTRR